MAFDIVGACPIFSPPGPTLKGCADGFTSFADALLPWAIASFTLLANPSGLGFIRILNLSIVAPASPWSGVGSIESLRKNGV